MKQALLNALAWIAVGLALVIIAAAHGAAKSGRDEDRLPPERAPSPPARDGA